MPHSKTPTKTKAARAKSGAKRPAKPQNKTADSTRRGTKQEAVLTLLREPKGATIAAIMKATGWQQHSVRGFFAGVVRKKPGLMLLSEKTSGDSVYGLTAGQEPGRPSKSKPKVSARPLSPRLRGWAVTPSQRSWRRRQFIWRLHCPTAAPRRRQIW
jgi:Protein of unknown function (DUF3489)